VTDGKAVGTYLEHKFRLYLRARYAFQEGNSARGIDFPDVGVDLKVTSAQQPQSSCPFSSAKQKVFGLGYALLVFVYHKTDDPLARARLLEALGTREATLAVLCKTTVAGKVLAYAWRASLGTSSARLYAFDSTHHFGAAVDAGLLLLRTGLTLGVRECLRVDSLATDQGPAFGYRDGMVVADVELYERYRHLAGPSFLRWRSGIKHDCSKVMELTLRGGELWNGLREKVEIEPTFVFPMLKSSELANGLATAPTRRMLVTQRSVGESTEGMNGSAPATWRYLLQHSEHLDRRGSSIYRGRSRFSIFGVGDYSFAPWKIAISGFYKRLGFTLVPPFDGRPVVLDDTAYFLPCSTREQADLLMHLLESPAARGFYSALVFWDSKRPITSEILGRLDLLALAREIGIEEELRQRFHEELASRDALAQQQVMFPAS